MKYIITESKLQDVALNWMDRNFNLDKIERIKDRKDSNSIYYKKDGKVVMHQDLKNKNFWFDYDEIWWFFKEFLGMEEEDILDVLAIWLWKVLKLRAYTPPNISNGYFIGCSYAF